MRKEIQAIALLLSLAVIPVLAAGNASAETIIVNSRSWEDVYSGVQYAKFKGYNEYFVKSETHAVSLTGLLPKGEKYLVINGLENFMPNYETVLAAKGRDAERVGYEGSVNIGLARKLKDEEGINNYIIVDDGMGYNAISVAPYAIVSKSYVLFANAANIDDIVSFLREANAQKVLIYGHVKREVRDALKEFNPEEINAGNRFANNREIVKRYLNLNPINQTILSNGEFIEDELLSGKNPIVFIGKNNIPDETKKFIKEAGFKYAVLIGNDLIPTATYVKRRLSITVFVKFAKGIAGVGNPALQDLDTFPVPRYAVALDVKGIKYNLLSNMLEVTYKNMLESPAYAKTTITLLDSNKTIGDEKAVFLDGFQEKTILYPLKLEDDKKKRPGIASVIMLYGEDEGSLEFMLQKNMTVSTIRILDTSKIDITGAYYDWSNKAFIIRIKNLGSRKVFASGELRGISIDGESRNIGSGRKEELSPQEEGNIVIRQKMSKLDIEENQRIKVRVYYGEREKALIKTMEKEFALKVKGKNLILTVAGAAVVAAVLIFFILRRKKDKRQDS